MSERPEEATEGQGMGLRGGGQVINVCPPFGQMIGKVQFGGDV
jgi:hypothetical protein